MGTSLLNGRGTSYSTCLTSSWLPCCLWCPLCWHFPTCGRCLASKAWRKRSQSKSCYSFSVAHIQLGWFSRSHSTWTRAGCTNSLSMTTPYLWDLSWRSGFYGIRCLWLPCFTFTTRILDRLQMRTICTRSTQLMIRHQITKCLTHRLNLKTTSNCQLAVWLTWTRALTAAATTMTLTQRLNTRIACLSRMWSMLLIKKLIVRALKAWRNLEGRSRRRAYCQYRSMITKTKTKERSS